MNTAINRTNRNVNELNLRILDFFSIECISDEFLISASVTGEVDRTEVDDNENCSPVTANGEKLGVSVSKYK